MSTSTDLPSTAHGADPRAFLLWQSPSGSAIGSSRLVLGADEVPALHEAQQLRDELEALRREQAQRVEQACEAARREGRARGLEQGRQQSRDELAAALAGYACTSQQQHARLRADVAALALQVVRKLMGHFGADTRLVGLASVAAREMLPAPALVLRVHPDRVEAVRDRLAALAAATDAAAEPTPAFELRADDTCAPDDCRIDTDLGSVDASLDVQLERLARAWGVTARSEEAIP
jgi:flagellar biosynthesis/type III secretory pathway protein FliH